MRWNLLVQSSLVDTLQYPYVMRNSDSGTNSMVEQYLKKQITKNRLNEYCCLYR